MKLLFTNHLRFTGFIFGILTILFLSHTSVAHAALSDTLSGYAWSSNIGWIKMNNCVNGTACTSSSYGVTMPSTGTIRPITGYAWSSNLGWIGFNASTFQSTNSINDCPKKTSRGDCLPYADYSAGNGTGVMRGWARVCSVYVSGCTGKLTDDAQLGGWDGFISLGNSMNSFEKGITIKADGTMSGYAWGSEVIGWVDFSMVKVIDPVVSCTNNIQDVAVGETGIDSGGPCAPTVTLVAIPNPVLKSGDTTNLTWTVIWPVVSGTTPARSCIATENWSGSKATAGSGGTPEQTIPITGPTPFTLTCTGPGGVGSARVVVTIEPIGSPTLCPDGTVAPGGNVANCPIVVDPGDLCKNIDGIQVAPLPLNYVQVAGGNCACKTGYVMNRQFQCVKPSYQEL